MMRFVLPCLLLGLVFFATGCGGDSVDSLAKEQVKLEKEAAELGTKGDVAGALAVAKKIAELQEKVKKVQDKKSDAEFAKEWQAALEKARK